MREPCTGAQFFILSSVCIHLEYAVPLGHAREVQEASDENPASGA